MPPDDGLMVQDEDIDDDKCYACDDVGVEIEDILFVTAGKGVADGGATKPVMGLDTWKSWMTVLQAKGRLGSVEYEKCNRRFRFGNNNVLVARQLVRVPFVLHGCERVIRRINSRLQSNSSSVAAMDFSARASKC